MIEDRLRAAARAFEDALPGDISPPLDLCRVHGQALHGPSRRRRATMILTPLGAAAAVLAVVGTLVGVEGGERQPAPAPRSALSEVPRYYMALEYTNRSSGTEDAVLYDSMTGATAASVSPPAPFTTFSQLAAAPDDRTFVLAAQPAHDIPGLRWFPTRLYRAQLSPSRSSVRLTPLTVPEFPSTEVVDGFTLSPGGTELAVALTSLVGAGKDEHAGHTQIRIYSVAGPRGTTTPLKVWSGPSGWFQGPPDVSSMAMSLSWARSGMLGFFWDGQGVRLLPTDASSGSLLGDSRLAPCYTKISGHHDQFLGPGLLTSDGTSIAAWGWSGFEEFSTATGKLTRILDPGVGSGLVTWANSSGSVLVGWAQISRQTDAPPVLGVLIGKRFEPIPRAPSDALAASVAF